MLGLNELAEHGFDALPVLHEELLHGDEAEVVAVLRHHVADGQEEIFRLP